MAQKRIKVQYNGTTIAELKDVGTKTLKCNGKVMSSDIVLVMEEVAEYTITTTIANGSYSGDTTILDGGLATVTLTASANYELPDTITVSGATYTYTKSTGVVALSNPTGNVTISAVCESTAGFSITLKGITGTEKYASGYFEGHINSISGAMFSGDAGETSNVEVTITPNSFTDVKRLVFDSSYSYNIESVSGTPVGAMSTDSQGNTVYKIIADGEVLLTVVRLD